MSEGFFSRWSRRKQEAATETPAAPEAAAPAASPVAVRGEGEATPAVAGSSPPLPTDQCADRLRNRVASRFRRAFVTVQWSVTSAVTVRMKWLRSTIVGRSSGTP